MGVEVDSAPACYGSSLGSNPDISQKYKMGDISKQWPSRSSPPKKICKRRISSAESQNRDAPSKVEKTGIN
jgi:hypothetical protein